MTIKIARKGIPMTPEILQKFKEHNEKLAREATISRHVDYLTQELETHGQVRMFTLDEQDEALMQEIVTRFENAGWMVQKIATRSIAIWLD